MTAMLFQTVYTLVHLSTGGLNCLPEKNDTVVLIMLSENMNLQASIGCVFS